MRRSEWYVVQVETGRERNACQVIQHVCESEKNRDLDGKSINLSVRFGGPQHLRDCSRWE